MDFTLAKLVVRILADQSQLSSVLAQVRQQLSVIPEVKSIKVDTGSAVTGLAALGNSLRQMLVYGGQFLGMSGAFTGSLSRMAAGLLTVAGATAPLTLGVSLLVFALIGLVALEYKAVEAFAHWNDEIIRQTAMLQALGKGADEIDHVVDASRRLADMTRLSQDQARVLITENERVTKSYQDAAKWAEIAALLASRFSKEGAPTPEKIAAMNEQLFRMLEMAKEPGGLQRATHLLMRSSGQSPELRAALLNVQSAEQLREVVSKFATQGTITQAADKTTLGFAWQGFVKDIVEDLQAIGKIIGPPIVAFLEGMMDALHEVWVQVRELLYSVGIDDMRKAVPMMREFFATLWRFFFFPARLAIAVIATLTDSFMQFLDVLVLIVAALANLPFIGGFFEDFQKGLQQLAHPTFPGGEKVEVPRIEAAGTKPEITGLVEFWRKLQTSVISSGTDPIFWARQGVDEQKITNQQLKTIAENTTPTNAKPVAVAA